MKYYFSVIVPVKKMNDRIKKELKPALEKQMEKSWELIVVTDKECRGGPGEKRDWGARRARGKILAFIDDDAYPRKDWLEKGKRNFEDREVVAVGGPGLTPMSDDWREQVSGWVWASWLGAGSAGQYRNWLMKRRLVDDYPSFNLMVKRHDFEKIGGFKTKFWPGEDTKLCQDLVYKLGKKIVYDSGVVVYHHRRRIFSEHLQQVGRFGKQRGYFAKRFPKTSLRLRYFWPSLFVLGLMLGWLVWWELYWIVIFGYGVLLIGTGVWAGIRSLSLRIGFLLMPAIFLTHFVYGVKFIEGLIIGLGLGEIAKE